jgi:DNA-binding protein HU-beta
MTKAEFIAQLATRNGLTKVDAGRLLNQTFGLVAEVTKKKGRFAWPGFGVFSIRTRVARNIRNPQTNGIMRLPASKTLGFSAAKQLKATL